MIVTNACLINAYHFGLGRHIYYIPPDQRQRIFMWLWIGEPTNLFAVFLVRVSICLFFKRLVPPKKVYNWTIWGTIAALIISDLYISIYYFFQCKPLRKIWDEETPGSCFSHAVMVSCTWLYQGEFTGLVQSNWLGFSDQMLIRFKPCPFLQISYY